MSAEYNIYFPDLNEIPSFPVIPIPEKELRDGFLVRSPNWLGDAVMTFPALRQLRKLLPAHCGLMVVCPKGLAPLFRALDCVDKVIPLADAHAFMSAEERLETAEANAGAAFFFNNSFRDALSLKRCGIPRMYGAAARFRSLLLTRSYPFEKRLDHVLNHPHQALKYLGMVQASGAPVWDGEMPVLTPDPLSPPCEFIRGIAEQEKRLLLLAPGAAYGDAKRFDPEKFRTVAKWWIDRGGIAAALGGPNEVGPASEALQGLPEKQAMNLAGRTNIDELILLLKRADLCVANDSGVMHLAAAAGAPGVAVFGSTDPVATGPLSGKWIVLYQQQKCSPCFRRICPEGTRACFGALTAEDVISAAERLEK